MLKNKEYANGPIILVNEGRIRLILNYNHTKEQLDYTVEVLERVCKKYQIIEEYVFKDYKDIDNLAV